MCGIFGLSVKKDFISSEQRGALLTVLAFGNEKRGDDSWGFWNGNKNSLTLTKGLGGIGRAIHKMFPVKHGFGHTRKATCGAKTVENAHPFEIGDIVGAHNGMIMNHDELNSKYSRKHEVDSMHLFSHINEGLPFDDIRGYGSIEWVNKKAPETIYLCRLSGGELSVRSIKRGEAEGAIVWSSDGNHLKTALDAAGLESDEYTIEHNTIYMVQNGEMFKTSKTLKLGERYTTEYGMSWEHGYSNYGKDRGARSHVQIQEVEGSSNNSTSSASSAHRSGNERLLAEWRAVEEKRKKEIEDRKSGSRTETATETKPDGVSIQAIGSGNVIPLPVQTVNAPSKETPVVPPSLMGKINADIAVMGDLQEVDGKWVGFEAGSWWWFDDKGVAQSIIAQ